jgi:nicotinate-nucleotide adenylyltransferase
MSEKRDLWVPALLAVAGVAVAGWDFAEGDVLRGLVAFLAGALAAGLVLRFLLRRQGGRAAALGCAGMLLSGLLSPLGRGEARAFLPWVVGAGALAFLPRRLPERLRAVLLGLAAVFAIAAMLAAVGLVPRRLLAITAVGALVSAAAVVATRERPDAGPPPGPRIAVFGGTFDPFHRGHRAIAEAVLKVADRLLVVVAGAPPHKQQDGRDPTPFHHRVAMARLGVEGLPRTEVLEVEGRRAGPSYTVDTLEGLRRTFPAGTRFLLVLGADSFQDLPLWRDWEGILERATLLVAGRPGFDLDAPPELEGRAAAVERLEIAPVDVSSTDLRSRVATGASIGERMSPAVAAYVRDHALYRGGGGGDAGGDVEDPSSQDVSGGEGEPGGGSPLPAEAPRPGTRPGAKERL